MAWYFYAATHGTVYTVPVLQSNPRPPMWFVGAGWVWAFQTAIINKYNKAMLAIRAGWKALQMVALKILVARSIHNNKSTRVLSGLLRTPLPFAEPHSPPEEGQRRFGWPHPVKGLAGWS